jgi:hypothetical protein
MHSTGIVGALKDATSRISRPKLDPLAWIIRFVAVAGIILIAKKAGFEFNWANSAVVLTLGLAALCGEFYFSGEVVRSWYERAPVSVGAFLLLWTCAFGYSVNQWLGAASDGQFEKAGFQQAAFDRTQDAAATERELAADVKRIQDKLILAPQRTPEAARAFQTNAKAHRFWKATDGCKETKGPQTREFCSGYASAVADESLATEAITLREELKVKQAELKKARDARKDAPVAVSAERTDLRIWTQYAGLNQQQAMDAQSIGTIAFISLVMSGLGMLREAKLHRGRPRKPWGIVAWFRRLFYGGPVAEVETNGRPEAQPAPTQTALKKFSGSIMDSYRAHCRTHGVAPAVVT